MPVERIDHYSVRTTDVEKSCRFYMDVMGFRKGPRPPFQFPGAWLYAESQDDTTNGTLHLVGIDASNPAATAEYLGERDVSGLVGSGAIDHIALVATDLEGMRSRLAKLHVDFKERTVPALGLHQVFVVDPSGITLELNYPASELA